MNQELSVHAIQAKQIITFKPSDTGLLVKTETKPAVEVVYRQVLWASFDTESRVLDMVYLSKGTKEKKSSLIKIQGKVQQSHLENAVVAEWTEVVMHAAYEGSDVKRSRRLKILVNPHGGIGKGAAVFVKTVEPILRAARCLLDVTITTHNGHARDIAKVLPLVYDVIVTVSGDGLIHEVMNGFANHDNPTQAFGIPIAPIPTGSGNGLSLNLLGIEKGFDVVEAALNVIKGRPMKVDVFSLTQNGKRTISFMSQALGLMADLDIGTENLRWMGDTRFMVGLIRGVIQFKPCPVQISIKVAEKDKTKMAEALKDRYNSNTKDFFSNPNSQDITASLFPPKTYSLDDTDGWTTFSEPLLYIYAGKGPYVGRDFMAFPVSLPDDGLIDVMAMPVSSRKNILASLGGAAKGEIYWNPGLHYVKAHAYRVKPLASKGSLAVDGEAFPFNEFQVEVHQGLATLLSPHGHYAAYFGPAASKASSKGKQNK